MFSGIVECSGRVAAARPVAAGLQLTVEPGFDASEVKTGDSVAVNGVCLTASQVSARTLTFDVVPETVRESNLGSLRPNARVNLERSLRLGDRIDGHWVQGHVDGTGRVVEKIVSGGEWILRVALSEAIRPYIVRKGSVAIDGVSLTIAEVAADRFGVAIIPTTLERTTIGERKVGDRVNIETDIVVRTIVENLKRMGGDQSLLAKLQAAGFTENS